MNTKLFIFYYEIMSCLGDMLSFLTDITKLY